MSILSRFLLAISLILLTVFFQNCGKHFSASNNNLQNNSFDICPTSGYIASANTINISGDCEIVGNVQLSGTAKLNMTSGELSIQGHLELSDNSALVVADGSLKFPQTDYSQYSVTLNNHSQLKLTNSTFVTNGTQQNNFSMALNANDDSSVDFENSSLNTETGSWLLGNFSGNSELTMMNTHDLPTEIYPSGATNINISSGSSFGGLWLEFGSGSNGTINVPTQNSQGNYNFSFGPTTGIAYSVDVSASKGRLGLNSHPNSTLIVNGNGPSGTQDVALIFGYYIENNSSAVTINGLTVGNDISRQFTDQGRNLQLNHVNLNPFTWQIYVKESNGFPVSITNSLINEITLMTNGLANVSTSVFQLAVTGAVGPGSLLNISNSQIWSQSILAQNGGRISISNSQLHGNFISATGTGSQITMSSVGEAKNGISPQTCASVNGYPPNNNGVPLCNPFNPIYQCSQVMPATGGATITATPSLTCPL